MASEFDRPTPPALPARQRVVLWAGILIISALAWIYLIRMPMASDSMADMNMSAADMAGMVMPMTHQWTLADAWLTFAMWAVMMVAMMLPSASPMLSMYARIASSRERSRPYHVWLFAAGYVAVWTAFSAGATALQFLLQRGAIMSDAMRVRPLWGGVILAIAGIYQLTPLKNTCLNRCRTPLGFFMSEWREGAAGAFAMGAKHGAFCTGCCWMLMALLFVAGVMNLAWVAAISALVLIEKAAPYGRAIARVSGVGMIAAGVAVAYLG